MRKKRLNYLKTKLVYTKVIKIFKYKNNNNKYQNKIKLYDKVIIKILFII